MMLLTLLLVNLYFGVLQASGLSLVVHTDGELESFRTKSIDLRCSFDNITSNVLYQVSWYKLNNDSSPGSTFITSLHDQEVHVEERQEELGLEGRVSIQPDGLSLNISDVSVQDKGIYRCEVTVLQPVLSKASSDVNLTVVDYQIRGYTENMVVGKGTPVTLTAIVSGSHLPSQNSWRLNGKEPLNNSALEATLMDQDGHWTVISTFTFLEDVDNTVMVTFVSYIPAATADDTYDNSSRTVEVQQVIVFREPTDFCDCRATTFAAAEAGCTIAGTVLAVALFFVHLRVVKNKSNLLEWKFAKVTSNRIFNILIVTLFLGVGSGIPVNFFAVQKVPMDIGLAVVIVLARTHFVLIWSTLWKARKTTNSLCEEAELSKRRMEVAEEKCKNPVET